MGKDGDTGTSFWKRLLRTIRNLIIAALIIVPCLYSVKIRLKLNDMDNSVDSLRSALAASYLDRQLGDRSTEAMFTIDTTIDASIARKAIQASMDLDNWVDSLRAPYPEGVSAHVKLHYLQSKAQRLERLQHHYSERFGE